MLQIHLDHCELGEAGMQCSAKIRAASHPLDRRGKPAKA